MRRVLNYFMLLGFLLYSFFRWPHIWFWLFCLSTDYADEILELVQEKQEEEEKSIYRRHRNMHSPRDEK